MAAAQGGRRRLRIAFLHPDLGIGGAERLVVDAAVSLQAKGHDVEMFTSHHDPKHCFEETRDGTLAVHVYGDFLPTHSCGRFAVLWAVLRNLYAALHVALFWLHYDVLFVDQLSISIPLLKIFTDARILFYCHFPDLLLTQRRSLVKRLYRLPFDWLEQTTTGMADCILVNSNFTSKTFSATFRRIQRKPQVLYPCINLPQYDSSSLDAEATRDELAAWQGWSEDCILFVSINRFERKKNIALAIKAFSHLLKNLDQGGRKGGSGANARLVVAGGYDPRNAENIEYCEELRELTKSLGLASTWFPDMSQQRSVVFLRSFTEAQRSVLLAKARAVLYTPSNEHFGIVPVEAMFSAAPVIAVNSGGPLESVLHGKTGFLCEPLPAEFASCMAVLARDAERADSMGQAGRKHVVANFSLDSFGDKLDTTVRELAWPPADDVVLPAAARHLMLLFFAAFFVTCFSMIACSILYYMMEYMQEVE